MRVFARVRGVGQVVLLILLLPMTCMACASGNGDLEVRVNQLEASRVEVAGQLQKVTLELNSLNKGQLIAVLDVIERADIHHMDEDLQQTTQINPLYVGTVRKLKRVIVYTAWPAPLKDKAEAFKAVLTELETALTNNDLVASREAVRKIHVVYHPLLDAGWKLIAAEPTD